jgi:hypothetical protein
MDEDGLQAFRCSQILDAKVLSKSPSLCIAVLRTCIAVGKEDGHIEFFSIDNPDSKSPSSATLMSRKKVSNKPIQQMDEISELNTIICLSGGKLYGFDADMSPTSLKIPDIKDVNSFCIERTSPYNLGISTKKKVTLFRFNTQRRGGAGYELWNELTTPETINKMDLRGEYLGIIARKKYSIINCRSDAGAVEILCTRPEINPLLKMTGVNEMLVCTTNDLGIFVDMHGHPSSNRTPISWQSSPLFLAACDDYLIGFEAKQAEVLSGVSGLTRVQSFERIASPIDVASFNSTAVALTAAGVFFLSMTTTEEQIQQFLQKGKIDEALKTLKRTNPSPDLLAGFNEKAGFALMQWLNYEEAFVHFSQVQAIYTSR